MSRVVFAFMYAVHFLPLAVVAAIGNVVGAIAFWLIPERRAVTRINLQKCFPHLPEDEREQLARAHFRAFCRSFIERGILWWAPRGRIERLVRIDGLEHLPKTGGRSCSRRISSAWMRRFRGSRSSSRSP
jgi:KDO2-lipid IV(A) lauroyltransferase